MRVLLVSASKYPSNTAEAARLHYLAQLFAVDNEVCVLSRGIPGDTAEGDAICISVSNHKMLKGNILMRAWDYWRFTARVKRYLCVQRAYDAIVVCAMPTQTLRYLIKYTKRKNIKLIHDAVEWYSPEEFPLGKLDRLYRKKETWMRKLLPGNSRIIAISRYLQNYFEQVGNTCVYIPSMIDTEKVVPATKADSDKIRIVYAGTPLKKDYLCTALDGIALLQRQQIARLEITIMGISRDQARKNGISESTLKRLEGAISFLGRIPRDEVFRKLNDADFSVLLRPAEQRYAKAGFPTKVPESMALGTPLICNFSSDLKDYLTDGMDCIEVSDCSAEAMAESMRSVLSYDKQALHAMSCAARSKAEKCFEYKRYLEAVRQILK